MIPRVLHVSQPVDAGVAVVLAELAEYQHASGWDVHVACPDAGWLAGRLRETGIAVHPWQATRGPGAGSLAEARRLREVVRRVRPDVVHLHSSKAGLAGRLALRGQVPTVFQPHAWSFHAAGRTMSVVSALWERVAVRWTHLVVAVSGGELHEGYRRGITPPRSVIVPNGVDGTGSCRRTGPTPVAGWGCRTPRWRCASAGSPPRRARTRCCGPGR